MIVALTILTFLLAIYGGRALVRDLRHLRATRPRHRIGGSNPKHHPAALRGRVWPRQ